MVRKAVAGKSGLNSSKSVESRALDHTRSDQTLQDCASWVGACLSARALVVIPLERSHQFSCRMALVSQNILGSGKIKSGKTRSVEQGFIEALSKLYHWIILKTQIM